MNSSPLVPGALSHWPRAGGTAAAGNDRRHQHRIRVIDHQMLQLRAKLASSSRPPDQLHGDAHSLFDVSPKLVGRSPLAGFPALANISYTAVASRAAEVKIKYRQRR